MNPTGAKIITVRQLIAKKYSFLEGLPPEFEASFGKLVDNFVMLVWGESGNGKSNFLMQLLKVLMPFGRALYVSLEEGHEASMQASAIRHLNAGEHEGRILFADHSMSYENLLVQLKRRKSAKFIIIDSVQYWGITYDQYKRLKETFPAKTFIFISHANGRQPDGKTADKIRYDAGIKVRVEGYVAFVTSRYGGNTPYVIWEEGAKGYWGKCYKKVVSGVTGMADKPKKRTKVEHETEPVE